MFFLPKDEDAISIQIPSKHIQEFSTNLARALEKEPLVYADYVKINPVDQETSKITFLPLYIPTIATVEALAQTDLSLLSAVQGVEGCGVPEWTRSMVQNNAFESKKDFIFRQRMKDYEANKDILAPVPGGETNHGHWVRVAHPDAAEVASALSETAVNLWIKRSSRVAVENPEQPIPAYFLLLDDLNTPTKSFVTMAAYTEADVIEHKSAGYIFPKAVNLNVPAESHVAGYGFKTPYPEFADDIEHLVALEGLHYMPNFNGIPLDIETHGAEIAEPDDPDDSPSM